MTEEKGVALAMQQRNLPMTGQLNRKQAIEVLKLVYPGIPSTEIERTAMLCADFGLHPLLKEVYIIPFNVNVGTRDKPKWEKQYSTVLGIQATRKMMARFGTFSYIDNTPRVMTDKEQQTIFGEVLEDRICAITKLKTKDGMTAQGYGVYLKKDTPHGMDKGNTRANMAFIRSERQAFSRLYPDHQIPQEVEIADENYIDSDYRFVDQETGEIIESEAVIDGEVIPEPEEQGEFIPDPDEDRFINETEIADLRVGLESKGLGMDFVGRILKEKGLPTGKLADMKLSTLLIIHEELNKVKA